MKFRETKSGTAVVRACGEQGHVMKSEGLVSRVTPWEEENGTRDGWLGGTAQRCPYTLHP